VKPSSNHLERRPGIRLSKEFANRSLHPGGDERHARDANLLRVLNLIRHRGAVSRISLARHADLAPSTITVITRRLIRSGLVKEASKAFAVHGRRATQLVINSDAYYALAVDLGRSVGRVAIVNLAGELVRQAVIPTKHLDRTTLGDQLASALWQFVEASGVSWRKVCGVGVGTRGFVDQAGLTFRSPVVFGWAEAVSLGPPLERTLGLPVIMENDMRAAALGEQLYGAARGLNGPMIYVTISDGVGAGIVIDGKVYRGAVGTAGEFGHITVDANGQACSCGNRGCIENFASVPAIIDAFLHRRTQDGDLSAVNGQPVEAATWPEQPEEQLQAIVRAARAGDPVATAVLEEAGHRLGQGIVGLVNLLDPQIIVLGRQAGVMGDILLNAVRETVAERTQMTLFDPNRIVLSKLGENGELKGLAALVVDRFLYSYFPVQKSVR